MINYDYVIVGGGPTGLSLAWILSSYNKKVKIIEKSDVLGGCHGVIRQNNLFSEHGPRIYVENYFMFKQILKEMNLNFYDLFTLYKFHTTSLFVDVCHLFTFHELFQLFTSFILLNESYKNISVMEYLIKYNFSDKSINYINKLCIITDGANIDRYTLYNFFQIINTKLFYNIYQPKLPNDIGIFKYWKDALVNNNVDISLNTNIIDIITENNNVKYVVTNNDTIYGKNFIFAIPPSNIVTIIKNKESIKNAFGSFDELEKFAKVTNYNIYITTTFHWSDKIDLKHIWGGAHNQTDWGLVFIIVSDYIKFDNKESQTVITISITNREKSKVLNQTPDEISDQTILCDEIFRQFTQIFNNIPKPNNIVFSQNYYDNSQKKWMSNNTAYVTTKYGLLNNKSPIFSNLYNCGTHNKLGDYDFTTIESAIQNAIYLSYDLLPDSNIKKKYKIIKSLRLQPIIIIISMIMFILVLYYYK